MAIEVKNKKSVRITKEIFVSGDKVMSLYTDVDSDTFTSNGVTQYIYSDLLYRDNKKEIRAEIANFQNEVYDLEDEMLEESKQEVE